MRCTKKYSLTLCIMSFGCTNYIITRRGASRNTAETTDSTRYNEFYKQLYQIQLILNSTIHYASKRISSLRLKYTVT